MYRHELSTLWVTAGKLAVRELEERARLKAYQLRIEYSQNGRVISDELFKEVTFFYTPAEAQAAIVAGLALAEEHGCGTAAVYFTPADRSNRSYLGTMNVPPMANTEWYLGAICPICKSDSIMCACQVEGLSAKARAEANHLKKVEEFRKANLPQRIETWQDQ